MNASLKFALLVSVCMANAMEQSTIKWNGQIGKYKDGQMTYYVIKANPSSGIKRLVKRKNDQKISFSSELDVPRFGTMVAKQPEDQSRAEYYELKKQYNQIPGA